MPYGLHRHPQSQVILCFLNAPSHMLFHCFACGIKCSLIFLTYLKHQEVKSAIRRKSSELSFNSCRTHISNSQKALEVQVSVVIFEVKRTVVCLQGQVERKVKKWAYDYYSYGKIRTRLWLICFEKVFLPLRSWQNKRRWIHLKVHVATEESPMLSIMLTNPPIR